MQTDKIKVYSNGQGMEEALNETSRFAEYEHFDSKVSMRMRLLSEEALAMVRAITGDFSADFWIQGTKENTCQIHVKAETAMDYYKKQELIELSSKKRNEASKGVMGKIRDLFENSLYSYDEASQMQVMYGGAPLVYGNMGLTNVSDISSMSYVWSLRQYIDNLEEFQEDQKNTEVAEAAWDELEKSIIANLADDVRVSVSGNHVELIIEKTFA